MCLPLCLLHDSFLLEFVQLSQCIKTVEFEYDVWVSVFRDLQTFFYGVAICAFYDLLLIFSEFVEN